MIGEHYSHRSREAIWAARELARIGGSPQLRVSHLLLGLIAEDQGTVDRIPGLSDIQRKGLAPEKHGRLLSEATAADLVRRIEAGRAAALELSRSRPIPMEEPVKRILNDAARLARPTWRRSVEPHHLWSALQRSRLPEVAALLSRYREFGGNALRKAS